MRISGLLAKSCAIALAASAVTTASPVIASETVSSSTGIEISDISTGDTAAIWFLPFLGTREVELSRSAATAAQMAPFTPYYLGTSLPSAPTIAPGEVVCVRTRDPLVSTAWTTFCTSRGRPVTEFRVAGKTRSFPQPLSWNDFGTALSLRPGASLTVNGLRPGMHVGLALGSAGDRSLVNSGEPLWIDPAHSIARTSWWEDAGSPVRIYRVAGTGTGFAAAPRASATKPIGDVVIFPEWFPFSSRVEPPPTLSSYGDTSAYHEDFHPLFWPDRDIAFAVNTLVPSGYRVELAVRRGSSFGKAPAWRIKPLASGTSRVLLRLPAGASICVRQRLVTPTGTRQPWLRTKCASRPIDDAHGDTSGRVKRVRNPYFSDGHGSRMFPGSRITFPQAVRAGTRVGFTWATEGDWSFQPAILGCGAGSVSGADPDFRSQPSHASAVTRRACRPVLRYNRTMPRARTITGLIVVPRWADHATR